MLTNLARAIAYADLKFLGHPEIIATLVMQTPGGASLLDPGPASCLETLRLVLNRAGARIADLQSILLTHIHLDHAGATGVLVRENPKLQVFVHERGAPHMVDPSRLLASATRLYGESRMASLWGEVAPVPPANVRALVDGDHVTVGERRLEVAYTPGHASHHVSYFDPDSRIAFVGDTGGIRRGHPKFVMPPTPPPDINLELWETSLRRIEAWDPAVLFVTHFGPYDDARNQLQELRSNLAATSAIVQRILRAGASEEDGATMFRQEVRRVLLRYMNEGEAEAYERAGPLTLNWQGLARYWRKKVPSP
ncbi:MAG: MBL fold metallo-hydrolase [Acidobacteria bacterium]|nr:MBL fold metallo-hydrolase [Acidobacteriota bacterium]